VNAKFAQSLKKIITLSENILKYPFRFFSENFYYQQNIKVKDDIFQGDEFREVVNFVKKYVLVLYESKLL
jgi:hypothetical protein